MRFVMRAAAPIGAFALALAGCISLASLDNGPAAEADDGGPGSDTSPDGESSRAARYRDAVLVDAPLAYWRFDEASGTTAKDELGAHPGVYRLFPSLGRPGIFGSTGAVELPASSNAHVEVPGSDFSFAGLAPYTFEAWVNPRAFSNYRWIAGTETTPPRVGWSVLVDETGEVSYEVWRPNDAGPSEVRSLPLRVKLDLGRFHHVVTSFSGNVMKGYIDGVLTSSNPVARDAPPSGALLLGCRKNNDGTVGGCLDGWSIDEVAVYDRPLSDERILAHYELGKP